MFYSKYHTEEQPVMFYYNYIIARILYVVYVACAIYLIVLYKQEFFGRLFSLQFYGGMFFFFIVNSLAYAFIITTIPPSQRKIKLQILSIFIFAMMATTQSVIYPFRNINFIDKTYLDLDKAYQNYKEEIVYLNPVERKVLAPRVETYNYPIRSLDGKDRAGAACYFSKIGIATPCHFNGDYSKPYRYQYFSATKPKGFDKLIGVWVLKIESLDGKEVIFDGRERYKREQTYNKRYMFVYLGSMYACSILFILLTCISIPRRNQC